ncbi:RimJ/RimL family protein N-acetyltransferase [Streptomyces sp. TE3672]
MSQWHAEEEPEHRHADTDPFLGPTDVVRTSACHLVDDRGYHRLVIDPAVDNAVAIRCYAKVDFRPVGVMWPYARDMGGTWHGSLLMDLLAAAPACRLRPPRSP